MSDNFSTSREEFGDGTPAVESAHFAEYGVFFIGLFGILGNSFVLYCFLSNYSLRRRLRNMLIIHQSIIDLCASILFLFCYGSKVFPKKFYGISGDILCALLDGESIMWLFLCMSTTNLVLITLERYTMGVHPVFYQTRINKCWILTSITVAWFITISFQGILFFYTSGVKDHDCYVVGLWPSRELEKYFCVYYLIVNFFLPLGVFIGCYGNMLVSTRRRQHVLVNCQVSHEGSDEIRVNYRQTLRLTATQANLTKTMVIVSACFVACWLPSHVHYFITTFQLAKNARFYGRLYRIVTYVALSNVCVNPLIYAFQYEDFKKAARKVIGRRGNDLASTTLSSS